MYDKPVVGLRNRCIYCSRVDGSCVSLEVMVWMVLSMVRDRYLFRGMRGALVVIYIW